MLIQVIYSNKRTGLVRQFDLDRLLAEKSIAAFRRADSWAIIGKDPVRAERRLYQGKERRGRNEEMAGRLPAFPDHASKPNVLALH